MNEMNLLAKKDEMNLLAEKMMNEFISKYCTCSFYSWWNFHELQKYKSEFPTTSISCRSFQKQSCQPCENNIIMNFGRTADSWNISAVNKKWVWYMYVIFWWVKWMKVWMFVYTYCIKSNIKKLKNWVHWKWVNWLESRVKTKCFSVLIY